MPQRWMLGVVAMAVALAVATVLASQSHSKRPASRTFRAAVTAYCISGETRSGTQTRPGIVAADPRVLPLGSVIRVRGLSRRFDRTYKVTDTGQAVKGRHIDIFIPDCAAAKQFGRQSARVQVVDTPKDGKG
jgi:3D (Asp-Asp-Asp) domain-containing protein